MKTDIIFFAKLLIRLTGLGFVFWLGWNFADIIFHYRRYRLKIDRDITGRKIDIGYYIEFIEDRGISWVNNPESATVFSRRRAKAFRRMLYRQGCVTKLRLEKVKGD